MTFPLITAKYSDLPPGFAGLSQRGRELVQAAIDMHRLFLQDGDLMTPVYLIEHDQCLAGVVVDGSTEEARDYSVADAKQAASTLGAEFVVFLAVTWELPEAQHHNADAILATHASIKKYPGAEHRALVNLETRHGRYFAMAPVLTCEHSKTRKKLGPVVWKSGDGTNGTFAGILPLSNVH